MKLVGLDIGTTTTCGLLLDPGTGEILAVAAEPTAPMPLRGNPWEALQDPDRILETVERILDRFFKAHADVRGIGVAGQMHGILYVDRQGRAASPLFTWQDGRGDRMRADGTSHAAHLSAALGAPVSTGMGFVTHYCNAREGLVPVGAVSVCTAADYVALRLARASVPVMDTTNAGSLGCFSLEDLDFRRDAMERVGVDASFFPRVASTYPALGEARPGVPVFTALGDNQASLIGAVRDIPGTVLVNVGTGSQISLFSEERFEAPSIDVRPFPFGGFLGVGAGLCGGRAYALLRGLFEETVRMFTGKDDAVDWEAMNAVEAASLTGGRLSVDTRFNGTRMDPGVRGLITNLGPDTFTPRHLIVGVREGIATELLDFYALYPPGLRQRVTSVVGSGNGIRLNPGLREAFEKRFGMPMRVPAHREETSFGAALLAGVASGALPDLAAAGSLIRYLATPALSS
jgi:sedoheptulokinase